MFGSVNKLPSHCSIQLNSGPLNHVLCDQCKVLELMAWPKNERGPVHVELGLATFWILIIQSAGVARVRSPRHQQPSGCLTTARRLFVRRIHSHNYYSNSPLDYLLSFVLHGEETQDARFKWPQRNSLSGRCWSDQRTGFCLAALRKHGTASNHHVDILLRFDKSSLSRFTSFAPSHCGSMVCRKLPTGQ